MKTNPLGELLLLIKARRAAETWRARCKARENPKAIEIAGHEFDEAIRNILRRDKALRWRSTQ